LPKENESDYIGIFGHKVENNELYYVTAPDGQDDIYHLDIASSKVTKLTDHRDNVSSYFMCEDNRTAYMTLERNSQNQTLFMQYELSGNQIKRQKESALDGVHNLIHSKDLWLHSTAIDNPGTFTKYEMNKDYELVAQYELTNLIGNRESLIHCDYKFVEYPSFDNEMVPAFLSLPKGEVKGAMIVSFYGGSNGYSWRTQLLAENGIAVLSPGVRGSWNYGKRWREKILGDLGGDEILDVHWGAKYLEKELGLSSSRIGVFGGSHGGYATLRAMTMPANFKDGVDCSYPYGFGICSAGFADLEDFYLTSNIPDWLVNMLGPYEGNEGKYKERSPIHFFENLQAPLLVSHGHNDARVSATSMEGFIDKLNASDKDYVLHLKEGIGHGSGDKDEQLKEYKKWVNFIEEVCTQ
jgi:dipeptidyl aminopeptidase/acylaminoacyl peptidase